VLLSAALAAAACRASPKPLARHYPLEGVVLAVNPSDRRLVVQHADIPGFMPAMTMPYPVADSVNLAKIETGDRIRAEVVVEGAGSGYLEHVAVIGHAPRKP
jgi:protein SCO1/2